VIETLDVGQTVALWVIFDRVEAVSVSRHVGYAPESGSKNQGIGICRNRPSWVCNRFFNVLVANGDAVVLRLTKRLKVTVPPHKPETLPPSTIAAPRPTRSDAARHPLLPGPFSEPGLKRVATG
jgi:hypothetical protein